MSHELRTPLNAILGFSQLMLIEAKRGDLVVKPHRVELIETAARHLLDLINEVLDVTRIESGQLEMRLAAHDPRAIIRECLPMVAGAAEAARLQIVDHGAAADDFGAVRCDRLRYKEVVINLLSNAVKYNRPGGRVEVGLRRVGERIDLVIADEGVGLDEAQLAGLFQPFNRLGAEATHIEGSGMGLFVSRRFVELMGGSITVRSARDVGTTVTVSLPVAAPGDAAADHAANSAP